MKLMWPSITKLNLKKSLYLPHLICLAGLVVSCAKAPVFPTKDLWETNVKFDVCRQYEIYDTVNFKIKHVKDWPLAKCGGVFGFSTSDIPKVLDWGYDMQKYAAENCK